MNVKISPNLSEGVAVFSSFDGHFAFSCALTAFLEIARTGSEKAHVVFKKTQGLMETPPTKGRIAYIRFASVYKKLEEPEDFRSVLFEGKK
jgi:hypothetical protein